MSRIQRTTTLTDSLRAYMPEELNMESTETIQVPVFELQRKDLESGAEQIRLLSASLDAGIQSLQRWFRGMEGRVEATTSIPDPDNVHNRVFHLGLTRPSWDLMFRYYDKPGNTWTDWRKVESGNLEAKTAAVKAAPHLLVVMQEHQNKLIKRLREANDIFNHFAEQVGLSKKEGS